MVIVTLHSGKVTIKVILVLNNNLTVIARAGLADLISGMVVAGRCLCYEWRYLLFHCSVLTNIAARGSEQC